MSRSISDAEVSDGVLDRLVAQIALDGTRIDAIIRQFVAAAMPQLCRSMCGWIFMSKPAARAAPLASKFRLATGNPESM